MTKHRQRYEVVRLVFLCFMAVCAAVREVLPLHVYIAGSYVSAAVLLCGSALIVAGLFLSDGCFSDRRSDVLFLFLAATVLFCAVNFRYGYADNIRALGAMVLFFFMVSISVFAFRTFFCYALHTDETPAEKKGMPRRLCEAVFRRKDRAA